MPTLYMCAGATGTRIVQLRPPFSSWGFGVGNNWGESLAFFIQPQAELSKYGSLNTFGRIKPARRQDFGLRGSDNLN
ncbi:unnamed protein product [marine sediment metagenome]|uniref:Uncharacterized protein n=1 Tax=marine sediment metagenome TaxID=412755 RepID=X1RPD8_9ZZZZ